MNTKIPSSTREIDSMKTNPGDNRMTSNDVIDSFSEENIQITIRMLSGNNDMVLIEGDRVSLEFLGKLIVAHAQNRDAEGCSIQFSPNGPGSVYFNSESTKGLYIHTTPCEFEGQDHSRL